MRKFFKIAATLLLLAALVVGGVAAFVQYKSHGRIYTDATKIHATDVALVMGAAVWSGRPSPYLKGRLDAALKLWRADKVRAIIVSGSTSDNEPATMRDYLIENGVPAEKIVMDEGGNDSYASCARAIGRFGVDNLTVVSQTYHLPRTVATCRMLGIDAYGMGDSQYAGTPLWMVYQVRELGANFKMLADVFSKRDVGQYEKDDSVLKILGR